jgi:mannose-6-phosphate isomerase-like protein (cupin superfamily)
MKSFDVGGPPIAALASLILMACGSAGSEAATQSSAAEGPPAAEGEASVGGPGIREASGFALWSAAELDQRNTALGERIGPDGSARETLRDYGNHRFRFIRRDSDGFPEQHDGIIDVVMVQSGRGELVLGGTLVDAESGSPGEWRGSDIRGGERHPLGPGDVMHIPATVPHRFLVPDGEHFTYVLVKFPAPG